MKMLLLHLIFISAVSQGTTKARFKAIVLRTRVASCTSSNQTVLMGVSKCFAKSYNRTFTTLNYHIELMRPIDDMTVNVTVQYRPNSQSPFNKPLIDLNLQICDFLNGSDKNVILGWILKLVEKTLPEGTVHSCPYEGVMEGYNLTISQTKRIIQCPRGYYRTILKLSDKHDKNIINGTVGLELI